jgi:hypothetical protein
MSRRHPVAQKLSPSQRWKHRRAPTRKAPVAPVAGAPIAPTPIALAPHINEARARARIARWVAWRIITWPPDNCLHSRRPIVFGAKWVELVNDDDRCRFHAECLPAWRLQQETAACRALGLKLEPALTERTP